MSEKKSGRVPVLEDAFEINLAKLSAASKRTRQSLLRVDNGTMSGEVLITTTKLAVRLAGRVFGADIVQVRCLKGRVRPLLKCPRAHEGNFQSLYYWNGELACRRCLGLRYRSNLASCPADRVRLARQKLIKRLGGAPDATIPERQRYKWRRHHQRLLSRLTGLSTAHCTAIRAWLAGANK